MILCAAAHAVLAAWSFVAVGNDRAAAGHALGAAWPRWRGHSCRAAPRRRTAGRRTRLADGSGVDERFGIDCRVGGRCTGAAGVRFHLAGYRPGAARGRVLAHLDRARAAIRRLARRRVRTEHAAPGPRRNASHRHRWGAGRDRPGVVRHAGPLGAEAPSAGAAPDAGVDRDHRQRRRRAAMAALEAMGDNDDIEPVLRPLLTASDEIVRTARSSSCCA